MILIEVKYFVHQNSRKCIIHIVYIKFMLIIEVYISNRGFNNEISSGLCFLQKGIPKKECITILEDVDKTEVYLFLKIQKYI